MCIDPTHSEHGPLADPVISSFVQRRSMLEYTQPWGGMLCSAAPLILGSSCQAVTVGHGACSQAVVCVSAGCEEAARVLQEQGVVERVHMLLASTDTPAAAAGGGTAALLRTTSLLAYAGFAMTAKPSVNLLLLLQVTSSCLPSELHCFIPCSRSV